MSSRWQPFFYSTCHSFTNNSVAYLADICDISVPKLSDICDKHLPLFRFIVICILSQKYIVMCI